MLNQGENQGELNQGEMTQILEQNGIIQPGGAPSPQPQPQPQPVELVGRDKQRLYRVIAPALTGAVPCEKAANLVEIPQTIYPNCRFIAIQHTQMFPPMTKYALVREAKGQGPAVVVFDWTAQSVHKANALVGLTLNQKNLAEYARFYLNRVRPLGAVQRLIEHPQQLNLTTAPDDRQLAGLQQIRPLQPVMVQMKQEDGSVKPALALLGTLAKNKQLFQALFFVTATGDVVAQPSKLLADKLDAHPDSEMPTPGSAGTVPLEAIVTTPAPANLAATRRRKPTR